jgi:hypothetical protein
MKFVCTHLRHHRCLFQILEETVKTRTRIFPPDHFEFQLQQFNDKKLVLPDLTSAGSRKQRYLQAWLGSTGTVRQF